MSDELDDFLRQAAERRRQRQQQKVERAPLQPLPRTPNAPTSQPADPLTTYRPTSGGQSNAPRPPAPTQSRPPQPPPPRQAPPPPAPVRTLSEANRPNDESRAGSRLQSQFDKPKPVASQQRSQQSTSPKQGNRSAKDSRNSNASSPFSQGTFGADRTTVFGEVSVAEQANTPEWSRESIAEQLRNPQSIRTAIIMSEVLKRPWE